MRMCHFGTQNSPFVLNKFFLIQTLILLISSTYLALSFVQNLKKIPTGDPEIWGCTIFGPKMVHLPQTKNILENYIIFIYLLAPFIMQNFKKILPVDPELWGYTILGLKWPICPNEIFFRKTANEPCSFHSCRQTLFCRTLPAEAGSPTRWILRCRVR